MKQELNKPGENGAAEVGIPIETVKTASFTMQYFRFGTGETTLVILPGLSVQSVMRAASAVAATCPMLRMPSA